MKTSKPTRSTGVDDDASAASDRPPNLISAFCKLDLWLWCLFCQFATKLVHLFSVFVFTMLIFFGLLWTWPHLLTPKVDRFMSLRRGPLTPIFLGIGWFIIVFTSLVKHERKKGQLENKSVVTRFATGSRNSMSFQTVSSYISAVHQGVSMKFGLLINLDLRKRPEIAVNWAVNWDMSMKFVRLLPKSVTTLNTTPEVV